MFQGNLLLSILQYSQSSHSKKHNSGKRPNTWDWGIMKSRLVIGKFIWSEKCSGDQRRDQPPALPAWLFPVLPRTSKWEWAGINSASPGGSKVPWILCGAEEIWGSSIPPGINTFKWRIKTSLSWHCTYFQPRFLDLLKLLLQLRARTADKGKAASRLSLCLCLPLRVTHLKDGQE